MASWQWCDVDVRERDGEDNVRTGDSYVVTVGTDHNTRSHSALSCGRAGGWPGVGW